MIVRSCEKRRKRMLCTSSIEVKPSFSHRIEYYTSNKRSRFVHLSTYQPELENKVTVNNIGSISTTASVTLLLHVYQYTHVNMWIVPYMLSRVWTKINHPFNPGRGLHLLDPRRKKLHLFGSRYSLLLYHQNINFV